MSSVAVSGKRRKAGHLVRSSMIATVRDNNQQIGWNVFQTALGWMAIAGRGEVLSAVTFGQATPQAARTALLREVAEPGRDGWNPDLARRLAAYAEGRKTTFDDVRLDHGGQTEFEANVIRLCRRIPYGQTRTYGELAALAGRPGAARAVGNVMATNLTPLIVPCHRVVAASSSLGGYSASGGTRTKLRLLEMEAGEAGSVLHVNEARRPRRGQKVDARSQRKNADDQQANRRHVRAVRKPR